METMHCGTCVWLNLGQGVGTPPCSAAGHTRDEQACEEYLSCMWEPVIPLLLKASHLPDLDRLVQLFSLQRAAIVQQLCQQFEENQVVYWLDDEGKPKEGRVLSTTKKGVVVLPEGGKYQQGTEDDSFRIEPQYLFKTKPTK